MWQCEAIKTQRTIRIVPAGNISAGIRQAVTRKPAISKMARLKICPDCHLPFAACNALAMYRKAFAALDHGEVAMAQHFARYAQEFESRLERQLKPKQLTVIDFLALKNAA